MIDVPEIVNSRSVSSSFRWIGAITEADWRGHEDERCFYAYGPMLVIVTEYTSVTRIDPGTGEPELRFSQLDFPIDTTSWIVSKLEPFAKGGILPGTMTRLDTEIDGERISLIRGPGIGGPDVPGWELANYSRKRRNDDIERFQKFPMSDAFLWEQGMFDLWKRIAREHDQGKY